MVVGMGFFGMGFCELLKGLLSFLVLSWVWSYFPFHENPDSNFFFVEVDI